MILHVCTRELIKDLRDSVLRLHGFEVISTTSLETAAELMQNAPIDLVLIDVEVDGGIARAEELCTTIKQRDPAQRIAFVCNYRVSQESTCPDDIIRADFDPEGLVRGVREALA
ncbi:response regulator [Acidipila rosea]|uniref:Response regulator receiver domain-containing protein n=1 Tax=Acidipila rosea TaxID=768535 RepID=A0A4R1L9Z8_9BACT|nr:response regulator [Acidipila rosea]MBW4026923.1 response regulator [Acidobacteriota bacterium]MBW4044991.1 response regulator [Acidobacteriota bacterium]TCK75208.1 response regulator receiver domain-containing protein [Acidipila rosea]